MTEYFAAQREQKKNITKEEKETIKAEKKEIEEKYGYAIIDGRREKVGNFRIEPPGLFRGRGDHPKTGTLKVCRWCIGIPRLPVSSVLLLSKSPSTLGRMPTFHLLHPVTSGAELFMTILLRGLRHGRKM